MAEDAAESGSRKAPQKIEKPVGGSTLAGFFYCHMAYGRAAPIFHQTTSVIVFRLFSLPYLPFFLFQ
jgi:hypothetical protein